MGIANTTTAAALLAALTGWSADDCVGRAGRARGQGALVAAAAVHRRRRQLATQLHVDQLAIHTQLLDALVAVAQAVDEGRQVALEDDREVAADGIHLADAQDLGAAAVHRQHTPVGGHRGDALLGAAQVVGAGVEAHQDVPGVEGLEQALLDQRRRQPHQPQGVALQAAGAARDVEHAHPPPVGPVGRAGTAGEGTVVLQEVFGAQHRHGRFLGQRRADGVGAAQVLVPRGAGHQRDPIRPAHEIGVAHRFEQQPVGVGQDHHAARFADLLEDVLHDRPALREQEAVALLLGLERHAVHGRGHVGEVGVAHAEAAAALPGAQDQGVNQAVGVIALLKEELAGLQQPFSMDFRPQLHLFHCLLRLSLKLFLFCCAS